MNLFSINDFLLSISAFAPDLLLDLFSSYEIRFRTANREIPNFMAIVTHEYYFAIAFS